MPPVDLNPHRPILLRNTGPYGGGEMLVTHVLYANDDVMLVRAALSDTDLSGIVTARGEHSEHLLVDRNDGRVLNGDWLVWVAEQPTDVRAPLPIWGDAAKAVGSDSTAASFDER